jgi:hypothetical protein
MQLRAINHKAVEYCFIEQPYLPDGISQDYIRWLARL